MSGKNALLGFWHQHEPELRRWLRSRAPTMGDADDLLQEVFIKALRHASGGVPVQQPRAWLFEVARHALIDHLRSARPTSPLPDDIHELPAPQPEQDAVDGLAQSCLPRVLSELDPQDREVIEWCDLQGLTQAEFAKRAGLTLPAAKSRIQRARRRMKEHMVSVCQVSFDGTGRVDGFVPRSVDTSNSA